MRPFLALITLLAGCAAVVEELPPQGDGPASQDCSGGTPRRATGLSLLQRRRTPAYTHSPHEEDAAPASLSETEDGTQTTVDLELRRVRADPGNVLSCTFDTRTLLDPNDPYQLYIFEGYWRWGKITREQVRDYFPGRVDSWIREDYTAQNVSDDFARTWQVLNDLSNRTGKQYWMIGGALIGALRHRSLLTKDSDGDFCMSQFSDQHISDAYPNTTEHFLYDGKVGKVYGRFIVKDGAPFVVAYEKRGAELLIFSLNSGLKIEMERAGYNCSDADAVRLLGKGQQITLEGGARVVVPEYPYQWLKDVERWPTNETHRSIEMPLDKFTSCSVCERTLDVCNTPDVFDKDHDGLRPTRTKQYIFAFTGTSTVRWACTQANTTLSRCKPAESGVTVERQYGHQT